MAKRDYDPTQYVMTFAGFEIRGIATGTFLEAERTSDLWTMESGGHGDVVRTKSNDKTGTVTITLLATVASNDDLALQVSIDEETNAGEGELFIKDLNGTTVVDCPEAWIRKVPGISRGTDGTPVYVWIIDCAEFNVFTGGMLS